MDLSATVAPSLELAASDRIVVGVVAAVALAALAIGFVLLREVLAAGQGTEKMQEISRAVQEGAAAYLNRQFRTLAIFVVVVFVLLFALARRRYRRADRPVHLLRDRRGVLRDDRLPRHVAGHPGERPRRRRRPRGGRPGEGHPHRVPHRWRRRHVHRRPRPLRCRGRRARLRRSGTPCPGGLRLRRGAARDVHAGRRRHLHQGRRRRRGPRRQGRAGHPGGRPAQRRHDRGQRRRQRRRLRRHGRRPVRVLRRDAGRRPHPGHRRVRSAGPALPADRAGHRRADRRDRRLHHPGPRGRGRPEGDQPQLLHLRADLGRAVCRRRLHLPACQLRGPGQPDRRHRRGPDRGPAGHRLRRRDHRHRAGRHHPVADRLLHRHRAQARPRRRRVVAHRRGHGDPLGHLDRLRVGRLHRAGDRLRGVRRVPAVGLDRRVAVRGGAGRHRPADHRRRHRRDGHLRPGQRQRPGHRGDVGRRHGSRRRHPDRARRGREHDQGDHQGHRDRDGRARRDGAVRLLP